MPAKKQQRNAFYFYMQELMPELRREGRILNGMADVVPIAHPRYKMLPDKEKQRFEDMAKEYKKRMRGAEGDKGRYDNVGNIIADRKDPRVEAEKRRQREQKMNISNWPPGNGVCHVKFYLIDFQILCKTEEDEWLPCEVGVVEYSMNEGITNTLHAFIDPGPIPTGYRFECESTSESTHKIPVQRFEKAERDYSLLYTRLVNFANPGDKNEEVAPYYTLVSETRKVYKCLQWLHRHARTGGRANRLHKVFELEGLLSDLFEHEGQGVSLAGATDHLTSHSYDYESNTRCQYHVDVDSNYCALGDCMKRAYAMSDTLANLYDFTVSERHLPVRDDSLSFTVIRPDNQPNEQRRIPPSSQRSSSSPSRQGAFGATDYRYGNQKMEVKKVPPANYEAEPKSTMRRPNAPAVASQIPSARPAQPPAVASQIPSARPAQPTSLVRPPTAVVSPDVVPPWSIGSTAHIAQQEQQGSKQSPPPWVMNQLTAGMAGMGRGTIPPMRFASQPGQSAATVATQPAAAWQQSSPVRAPPGISTPVGGPRPAWSAPNHPGMRGVVPPWSVMAATPGPPQGVIARPGQVDSQMSSFQQQLGAMSVGGGRGRGRGVFCPSAPPGFST